MSEKCHKFLTKKELAKRWEISHITLERWIKEGAIKPFKKDSNYFPLDYIEAIELANVNIDQVNVFTLRAKNRQIDALERENALLKSRLYLIVSMATEGIRELIEEGK